MKNWDYKPRRHVLDIAQYTEKESSFLDFHWYRHL